MADDQEPIPSEFRTLEEAGEFWDSHSAADYWDEMEDVACEVNIQSHRYVVFLDNEVYHTAERAAATHGVALDRFVNQVLRRELAGARV